MGKRFKLLYIFLISTLLLTVSPNSSTALQSRISGLDRFDTAVEVSKSGWRNSGTVVITQGFDFPDALSGVSLAYKLNAPILLTKKDSIPKVTYQEIIRLKAKNIVILGGLNVVSKSVEDSLKTNLKVNVSRIGGENRFETANLIAKRIGSYNKAILVNGLNFPDALSVAAYAAKQGYPILLSGRDKITGETLELLKKADHVYAIGGEVVLSEDLIKMTNAERISGVNRYQTAAKFVKKMDFNVSKIYLATGENFADALTGALLAAKKGGAIILAPQIKSPIDTKELLNEMLIDDVIVLGGTSAISNQVFNELKDGVHFSASKSSSSTMIFYSPHPDDELLSMGVGIRYYLNRGFNVHVVLLSKGRESSVYPLLLRDLPDLTKEEFGEGRVREFVDAVVRLGVPLDNVHVYDLPDGSFVAEDVKEIIQSFENRYPNAHHRAFSFKDNHNDHRMTGIALRELYLHDRLDNARYYVSGLQLNQLEGYNIPLEGLDYINDSIHAYEIYDPDNGRYAIGIKSVPGLFSQFRENPRSEVLEVN